MTDHDAIRARLDAATPGPWKRTGTAERPHWFVSSDTALVHGPALTREPDTVQQTVDRWVADATFIAHAPTDIADLLAENERLRAEWTAHRKGCTNDSPDAVIAHIHEVYDAIKEGK